MAAETKLNLIQDVMLEVGDPTTDTDKTALYRIWFDDALETVMGAEKWREKLKVRQSVAVTASGFTSAAVPDGLKDVKSVYLESSQREIRYIDFEELVATEQNLDQTSTVPDYWYWYDYDSTNGNPEIGLWPKPSADITLELSGNAQVPVSLGDTAKIPMPREFLSCLRNFVRFYAYQNEGLEARAQSFYAIAQQQLSRQVRLEQAQEEEAREGPSRDGWLRRSRWPSPRYPRTLG